jgi:hypothetical protein
MTLQEVEALTRYRDAKITNVKATPDEFAFELKEVARTRLEPTVEEMFKAREKGGFKKVLITRHLKYTMPTPVYTPFDIVISKVNNLFLDTTYFVWEFDGFGEGMLKNFTGFNYRTSYKDQFFVEVDFPAQVNKPVCIDVLAYLHWAAKHLSRQALEQADIEGHFENPQKAHERRVMLLDHVSWGTDTGKPFRWLLQKISRMVKSDYATEDVIEGLRHVKEGVEAITFDLSRIWEKRLEHEYLYTGPKSVAARRRSSSPSSSALHPGRSASGF